MIEFNLGGLISTCLVVALLLGILEDQVLNKGWFSQVVIAGALSTLVALIPSLHKGNYFDWSLCYLLVGVLVLSSGLMLSRSFFASQIARVINHFRTIQARATHNFSNNAGWSWAKTVVMKGAKVLFIIAVALWAIITYPARHSKQLALPQGKGEKLAFNA